MMKQATRDLLLSIQESLRGFFKELLRKECKGVLSPKLLQDLLGQTISNWSQTGKEEMEIFCSEGDQDQLFDYLQHRFQKELAQGVTLNVHPELEAGFRLNFREKDYYLDVSDQSLAETLSLFFAPKLRTLLEGLTHNQS